MYIFTQINLIGVSMYVHVYMHFYTRIYTRSYKHMHIYIHAYIRQIKLKSSMEQQASTVERLKTCCTLIKTQYTQQVEMFQNMQKQQLVQ